MSFLHRPITTVTACTSSVSGGRAARGFSLVELAVVMLVMGILLAGIVVPLSLQLEGRNYDQTQRILDQAREALLGYAAANGYFPCPATTASNGLEATGFNHASGAANTCPATVWGGTTYVGLLPAAALGFTPTDANGYAVDAWGFTQNRIRYAVAGNTLPAINGVTQPFTRVNGMRTAGMSNIGSPTLTTLLYVCNSGTGVTAGTNCGTAVALTNNAPVVIWSVGPNAATGGVSVDEKQNPNPKAGFSPDRIFVSRIKAAADETGGEFDDIVTWIGLPTLFSRLIAAGQLP